MLCLSATVSLCVAVGMPRGPVWESVQPAGFHAIKPEFARSRFAACVPLACRVDNQLPFAYDQSRLTWKWLPWGAECLDDSAPLLRRRRCALSWCGRGRHCSGLRRSLSAAGLVLRCLCSLASHCAGSAGRRVWTAIWMFALKSCQLGLSAARDASVLAAILRRASLTASALAAPAAQHWPWLHQWPELSAHCVSAHCPVLLRVRVRVALPRIGPACASGPALVLAAPVAPVVNRRSFTAGLRRHAVKRRSFTCR